MKRASRTLVDHAKLSLRRGGLTVRKTYKFHPENYLVDFGVTVERDGKPLPGRLVLGQDLGPEHEHLLSQSAAVNAVSSQGGKVNRESPPKDENEIKRIGGDIRWVGLDMQYFALISIPKGGIPLFEIQKRPVKTVGLKGEEISRDLLRVTIPGNAPGRVLCSSARKSTGYWKRPKARIFRA